MYIAKHHLQFCCNTAGNGSIFSTAQHKGFYFNTAVVAHCSAPVSVIISNENRKCKPPCKGAPYWSSSRKLYIRRTTWLGLYNSLTTNRPYKFVLCTQRIVHTKLKAILCVPTQFFGCVRAHFAGIVKCQLSHSAVGCLVPYRVHCQQTERETIS